jgi:hypothetical protein
MKITIKDYNLQNIIFVHNFVLIFLIFVLLFVGTYLAFAICHFSLKADVKLFKFIFKESKKFRN